MYPGQSAKFAKIRTCKVFMVHSIAVGCDMQMSHSLTCGLRSACSEVAQYENDMSLL